MTEGTEMSLKRLGHCLQTSEYARLAASGYGSVSQGCTAQEGSLGVIVHPGTGCSPRDDGQKVLILTYIKIAFLREQGHSTQLDINQLPP